MAVHEHIVPFKCTIPVEEIDDFQTLLKLSKIAVPTYENQQEDRRFGVSAKWLSDAKDYWLNKYDWYNSEEKINSFEHFIAPITDTKDGETYHIHFIALHSKKAEAIPIVFLHGWPGSFLEFIGILSYLKEKYTPEDLPYHIIVPSLPGYAWSSPPPLDRDFTCEDIARLMDLLMQKLGFGKGYVTQGGDIGSKVSRILGVKYDSCKAVHINFCSLTNPESLSQEGLTPVELKGLARAEEFLRRGAAYAIEHASRPSTIGLVLSSNPLALLAWIGEKLLEWSDEDPPLDTILEMVTLYWLTSTFPRSIYPYRERFNDSRPGTAGDPAWNIIKPFGYSCFPQEILCMPESWAATTGNLVFFRRHTKGGHFAALEQPKELWEDVAAFIDQVWEK